MTAPVNDELKENYISASFFRRAYRTDIRSPFRSPNANSTISHPSNNHGSTILRVETKNDTISTQPSYFPDSTTPTDTQKQFNLNQKTGARSSVQSPLQAK